MLTLRSFPVRSARYHWRANLPVLLGVAVGSAVLAGALLVGDSLRGSLRDRSLRQLNGVQSAYVGAKLVRQDLAKELGEDVIPALILQGSATFQQTGTDVATRYLSRVTVIGLNERGRKQLGLPPWDISWDDEPRVAMVSESVAKHFGLKDGESLELSVEKMSNVPRSSVLGKRDIGDLTTSLRVVVVQTFPEGSPQAEFNLMPNPTTPAVVYVPLPLLQLHVGQPKKVNALLAFSDSSPNLAEKLTLADWGLKVRVAPKRSAYVSVESEQLVLDPTTVRAIEAAAKAIGARSETTYSYLANAISIGDQPVWNKDAGNVDRQIPYSVVAALNPAADPPLGPFLPPGVMSLAVNEIVLADWDESPFRKLNPPLKPGDPITLTYFKPEMEASIEEAATTFRFAGFVPLSGPAADGDLTPPFPGITDKLTISEWDSPFELNNRRIRPRDEKFWDRFRATPKAYVTKAAGERMWASRFGDVTSIRVAPIAGSTVEQTAEKLRAELPKHLHPANSGFVFEPVRERLLTASQGGTDFGILLLAFSCFLIGSALLLVGLLFRLSLDRRAKEVGLLLAAGFPETSVRRILLKEGIAVAAVGALLGLIGAVGFAWVMIRVLTELWPTNDVGRFLTLHVTPMSLAAGFFGAVFMAAGTIWFSLRGLVKIPVPALLRGETTVAKSSVTANRKPRISLIIAGICVLVGGVSLAIGGKQSNPDFRAMAFFSGGGLLMTAGLLLVRAWLRWPRHRVVTARGFAALFTLGSRNATRNATRSLLTITLIAVATFLLVAVESFRRRPDADFLKPDGGSGGFRLLAEADVPIFQPFDREPGKGELLDQLSKVFQDAEAQNATGPSRQERLKNAEAILDSLKLMSFRVQSGDDASCLNLYQAGRPRVFGVPDAIISRGGFQFAETEATTDEERKNPWLLLTKPRDDGAIPVFAEQNTVMWMLKTAVGGELTQPDGEGRPVKLRIVGTLQDSVFQSELLMSDANFRRLYPRQEGFRVFLIDTPEGSEKDVGDLLETGLRANGLTVTRSTERVAAFQKVIGTYLTTFQLLGGFGLLLGVLGLGIVILRAVWERVGELALLRAVGYRTGALQTMILSENVLLLVFGMTIGVVAAVASVLPNLALGGSVNVPRLAAILGAVFVAGLLVAVWATNRVSRVPLVPALRKE